MSTNRRRSTRPSALADEMAAVVGPEGVIDAPEDLLTYECDGYTIDKGVPSLVVLPRTPEQVAEVIRILQTHQKPFVARGAGTCLSGGANALNDSVVLALTRMNRILEIDHLSRRAVVEAGVINLRLTDQTSAHRLHYAPDPSSQGVCTMGGNVGENSSGAHTLKYGVSSNHVLGLEMVLPDGQVVALGGKQEDPAGYDLRGVVMGSEGTLGVVTKVVVRLTPLPEAVRTMAAVFDALDQASETVTDIIASGIIPAALEMMDNTFIRPVEETYHPGFPMDAEAVLIIELDGPEAGLDALAERVIEICKRHGARSVRLAEHADERDLLWKSRKMAVPASGRYYPSSVTQDGAVPRSKLPEVLREIRRIAEKHNVTIGNVFHAGDGNLHPVVLFDERDPDQMKRMIAASEDILRLCLSVGGTITGEHGVGSEKIHHMTLQFSEAELDLMRRIRSVFDPEKRANPGKLIPDATEPIEVPPVSARPQGNLKPLFAAAVGEDRVRRPEPAHALDGRSPRVAVYPQSEEEVAAVLRTAFQHGLSVVPIGGATDLQVGYPPREYDVALVLRDLPPTIEPRPEDMTITASAGTTLAQLQQSAKAHGHFVPLLLPHPERATLGGILASGRSGPLRFGYRSLRDLVLGIKVAAPEGEILKAGGSIVKNVAGYEFSKLYLGSRGSLGVILGATLRTYPLPEHTSTVLCALPSEEHAQGAFEALMTAGLPLSMLDFADAQVLARMPNLPVLPDCSALILGVDDAEAVARWTVDKAYDLCLEAGAAAISRLVGEESEDLRAAIVQNIADAAPLVTARISVPPAASFSALAAARNLGEHQGLTTALSAHLGSGIVRAQFVSADADPDQSQLAALVTSLNKAIADLHGSVLWERVPGPLKADLDLWVPLGSDFPLMRRLKDTLDPRGVMSPGRFAGRL